VGKECKQTTNELISVHTSSRQSAYYILSSKGEPLGITAAGFTGRMPFMPPQSTV